MIPFFGFVLQMGRIRRADIVMKAQQIAQDLDILHEFRNNKWAYGVCMFYRIGIVHLRHQLLALRIHCRAGPRAS